MAKIAMLSSDRESDKNNSKSGDSDKDKSVKKSDTIVIILHCMTFLSNSALMIKERSLKNET